MFYSYRNQGRSQEFILTEARGLMASAGARAYYNGGLGAAPAGSRGRAPGQGVNEAPLKLNASKLRSAHRKAQIWPCLRDFSVVYTYKKNQKTVGLLIIQVDKQINADEDLSRRCSQVKNYRSRV